MTHTCTKHQPSTACYHSHHCRCDGCKKAKSVYAKRNKFAAANGHRVLIDPRRTQAHIARLVDGGLSLRQIERLSGVAAGRMPNILAARGIQRRTAAAILAVPLDSTPPMGHVPAIGTIRRLRALQALGWSITKLATLLGRRDRSLRNTLTLAEVHVDTHRAVVELYESMWDRRPPEDTADQRRQVARARNYAVRNGWAPPAAWDEDGPHGIDNPDATPACPTDPCDDAGAVEWMAAGGDSLESIAARLGVKPESIYARCRRADRLDLWRSITNRKAA